MQLQLDSFNRKEVLQYLMWRGSEIPDEIDTLITSAMDETRKASTPKYVWRLFSIDRSDGIILQEAGLRLPGENIRELLKDCDRCLLMAVTMGNGMDRIIAKAKGRDLSRAVVLDSCGSAAIEAACDLAEKEIRQTLGENVYLTDRFSPGYGDLPLNVQGELMKTLDTERKIGLTLTDSLLMVPAKSVTAVIGISNHPQKKRFRGCAYCSMFETCSYRKGNQYCGRV